MSLAKIISGFELPGFDREVCMSEVITPRLGVIKADLIYRCLQCGEPATGDFDCDRDAVMGDDSIFEITLECVNCGDKEQYLVQPTFDSEHIPDSD